MKLKLLSIGISILFMVICFTGCNDLDLGEVTQFSVTSFIVEPSIINQGDVANLSWVVMSAQTVTIDHGIGNVSNIGNRIIMPAESTIYTLTAKNGTKTLTVTAEIIVKDIDQNNSSNDNNDSNENETNDDEDSIDDDVPSENVIEIGDCVDIHYIGKYEDNNTVFDSSYSNVVKKSGGEPLKVFVTFDKNALPPVDYRANYSSGIIEGLMEELPGLQLGRTYTIGPIDPAKAYGEKKLEVGSTFNTATFAINTLDQSLSLNQTFEVTKLTDVILDLKWINIDQFNTFTMPQIILGNLSSSTQEEMTTIPPPYFIWENASEIESINENTVTVKTTPNKMSNIFDSILQVQYGFGTNDIYMIFPDATTASYDETTITLTSEPTVGDEYEYVYEYFGQQIIMNYEIQSINGDIINVSATYEETNESQYLEVNKTLSFDRYYEMKRVFKDIPIIYTESLIGPDIQREGYSLHNLAGESLIFEIYVQAIHKTSNQ